MPQNNFDNWLNKKALQDSLKSVPAPVKDSTAAKPDTTKAM